MQSQESGHGRQNEGRLRHEASRQNELEREARYEIAVNGFGLQCSVCKTYFTFGVVAVEHPRISQ